MRRVFSVVAAMLALVAFAQQQDEGHKTRVDFSSQPSGAAVIVDGVNRGVTPTTLFGLPPGRHLVKYSLAGYSETCDYITVNYGFPVAYSEVLYPEKGLLLVKSSPDGCEISIDGISLGLTPRLITNLNAKDAHRMTLSKAGYKPAMFDVKFDGRKPLVRNETLIRDSGLIHVFSEPAGAEVTLNGIVRGKTPVTVEDVPKGQATIKLSLEGFKDEIISDIVVNPGDEQTISRALAVMPGTLFLSSVPEGARFYVNGEYRGVGPLSIPGLTPGDYEVRAEKQGYAPVTRAVTVQNGATPREEFRLENVMGRLDVRTSPAGAQVYLDGTLVGTTSSNDEKAEFSDVFPIEDILEGEHTLVVRKKGYAEQTRHPKIRSRKTSSARVRLRRVFVPDVEIVTTTGRHRGILVEETPDLVIIEVTLGVQSGFPQADVLSIRRLEDDHK